MIGDIRQHLKASPFEAFTIVTSSGWGRYPVPTSDHAGLNPRGTRAVVWFDDDSSVTVAGLHVVAIEKGISSAGGNGIIPSHKEKIGVPRRFQWYIAEGMLSLPTAKWSMVISFFSGVMASGFAFGCAKDTVEFFNAGIGEVRFPVGEGFLLVIFDYVGPWV